MRDKEIVSYGKLSRSEYILWVMAIWYLWPRHMCTRDGSERFRRMLLYPGQLLGVQQSGLAGRNLSHLDVIWMKRSSSGVTFLRSVRFWVVSSQPCLPETNDFSINTCFMNIKMTSNIINVGTSLNHLSCVRLLWASAIPHNQISSNFCYLMCSWERYIQSDRIICIRGLGQS